MRLPDKARQSNETAAEHGGLNQTDLDAIAAGQESRGATREPAQNPEYSPREFMPLPENWDDG